MDCQTCGVGGIEASPDSLGVPDVTTCSVDGLCEEPSDRDLHLSCRDDTVFHCSQSNEMSVSSIASRLDSSEEESLPQREMVHESTNLLTVSESRQCDEAPRLPSLIKCVSSLMDA